MKDKYNTLEQIQEDFDIKADLDTEGTVLLGEYTWIELPITREDLVKSIETEADRQEEAAFWNSTRGRAIEEDETFMRGEF